jgi:hypothetical protein
MTLTYRTGRGGHAQLLGTGLYGTSEIETFQKALNNLGVATQRPAITCAVNGTIDDATMLALAAGLELLTKELPTWLYVGIQGALVFGVSNATAKKYVGQYASQLTIAANTAATKFKVTPPVVVPAAPPGFFAPGWYKEPRGLILIAAIGLGGYLIFSSRRAPAKGA